MTSSTKFTGVSPTALATALATVETPSKFTPTEASTYLWGAHRIKRSPARLKQLRNQGGGPSYRRDGAIFIIYTKEALDAFAEQQLGEEIRSTAEESARKLLSQNAGVVR